LRWKVNESEEETLRVHWRKLHNEELHDIYHISHYYVCQVKIDKGWAGHVAGKERIKFSIIFWRGHLKERDQLRNLGIEGK